MIEMPPIPQNINGEEQMAAPRAIKDSNELHSITESDNPNSTAAIQILIPKGLSVHKAM